MTDQEYQRDEMAEEAEVDTKSLEAAAVEPSWAKNRREREQATKEATAKTIERFRKEWAAEADENKRQAESRKQAEYRMKYRG